MLAALVAISTAVVGVSTAPVAADAIELLLRDRGELVAGRFTVAVPQTDLQVTLDGFSITPAMGLTSWIAFTPRAGSAEAVGDLAVLEEEAALVQRQALAAGFSVTALHHRFLRERPKIAFLIISATGELDALTDSAQRLLSGLPALRAAKGLQSGPTKVQSSLDQGALERVLRRRGAMVDGVLKFALERPELKLGGFDGRLAFQGTMEKAAVAGDLAMEASKAPRVAGALTAGGLEIAGLHDHGLAAESAVRFIHFWGVGRALALAEAVSAAMERLDGAEDPGPRSGRPAARKKL